MRPRHKAAENATDGRTYRFELSASMRPRHKAAENREAMAKGALRRRSFNEAAA